ncbi:uncharacterized, partial [Tachysurus ichikawai]
MIGVGMRCSQMPHSYPEWLEFSYRRTEQSRDWGKLWGKG